MIERVSAVQQTEKYLISHLQQDSVNIGDKLPTEMSLCETLGVSRGTIREATRLLQARGFVEIRPGRGAFVIQKTEAMPQDIASWFQRNGGKLKDLNDVRMAIETIAVQRAIENQTPKDLMQLHTIHARSIVAAEQDDAPTIALCDEQFHSYIFQCARNPLLAEINQKIQEGLVPFRSKTFRIHSNVENFIPAHGAILEAFELKDPELGRKMMEQHLKTVAEDVESSKIYSE